MIKFWTAEMMLCMHPKLSGFHFGVIWQKWDSWIALDEKAKNSQLSPSLCRAQVAGSDLPQSHKLDIEMYLHVFWGEY